MQIAHAASDELAILCTKVEYKDLLVRGVFGHKTPLVRQRGSDSAPWLSQESNNTRNVGIYRKVTRPCISFARRLKPYATMAPEHMERIVMKRILLIATGGTIASSEDGNGLSPTVTGEELAQAVPEIAQVAHVEVAQLMNIDSTNMRPSDWLRIARAIRDSYDGYDGFVVLHGTDTMAYTAAALSYLIQESPKPIVLTGSQKPMENPFTDAKLNLYQSLLYATDNRSRDITVVFGGAVIAGTRARKQRTMSFNAFKSVNYPSLAYVRNGRIIRSGEHMLGIRHNAECAPHTEPRFFDALDEAVFALKLTPGMNPRIFEALKASYDAVIIETFGIGGIPEYENEDGLSFKQAIFDWVDSGRTAVITTQVPEEGLDLGVYEVGRAYAEHPGILKGDDMTTEALVAKTMWARGVSSDPKAVKKLFMQPINFDRMDWD